jgi:hypothetical protein
MNTLSTSIASVAIGASVLATIATGFAAFNHTLEPAPPPPLYATHYAPPQQAPAIHYATHYAPPPAPPQAAPASQHSSKPGIVGRMQDEADALPAGSPQRAALVRSNNAYLDYVACVIAWDGTKSLWGIIQQCDAQTSFIAACAENHRFFPDSSSPDDCRAAEIKLAVERFIPPSRHY